MTSFKNFNGSFKNLAAERSRETIDITLKDESIIEKAIILTPIRDYLKEKIKIKKEEIVSLTTTKSQDSTDLQEN